MKTVRIAIAAVAAAAAGLAAAYAVAGPEGLATVGTVLAAAAVLAARATITPPAAHRPARRRVAASAVRAADFPAYQKIEYALGWAGASRRHYDRITRPVLTRPVLSRLLGAALQERRRLDITQHQHLEEARRLVGTDLWPLIDPSAPPSDDSGAPGPGKAALSRTVDRLEQL